MSGALKFDRTYIDFGPKVRDVEKTADVVAAYEDMLTMYGYPCGDQVGAHFTAQWLGEGEKPENDPETLDLIFEIPNQPFLEIILNGRGTEARYGGWLSGAQPVTVTDEIANGFRVLMATQPDGSEVRHEYNPGLSQYLPTATATALPLAAARRMSLRRAV